MILVRTPGVGPVTELRTSATGPAQASAAWTGQSGRRPPGCCCCGTARPRCRSTAATPATATPSSPRSARRRRRARRRASRPYPEITSVLTLAAAPRPPDRRGGRAGHRRPAGGARAASSRPTSASWEGLTFTEARERDPELHAKWLGAEDVAPPGGESFAAVRERVGAELASIVEAYEGETVVLVTPRHPDQDDPAPGARRQRRRSSTGCTWTWRASPRCTSSPTAGMCVRLVNDTSHRTA